MRCDEKYGGWGQWVFFFCAEQAGIKRDWPVLVTVVVTVVVHHLMFITTIFFKVTPLSYSKGLGGKRKYLKP